MINTVLRNVVSLFTKYIRTTLMLLQNTYDMIVKNIIDWKLTCTNLHCMVCILDIYHFKRLFTLICGMEKVFNRNAILFSTCAKPTLYIKSIIPYNTSSGRTAHLAWVLYVISNTRVKWETVETMNDFRLQLWQFSVQLSN